MRGGEKYDYYNSYKKSCGISALQARDIEG